MAKKAAKKTGECKSCKARRVVNGICNACGVVQSKDVKPDKDGPD